MIALTLAGVTTCEFRHFDGDQTTLLEALTVGEPEILSTDSTAHPITVHTTLGQLVVLFASLELELDSGDKITYEQILAIAKQYWDEFESRRTGI